MIEQQPLRGVALNVIALANGSGKRILLFDIWATLPFRFQHFRLQVKTLPAVSGFHKYTKILYNQY